MDNSVQVPPPIEAPPPPIWASNIKFTGNIGGQLYSGNLTRTKISDGVANSDGIIGGGKPRHKRNRCRKLSRKLSRKRNRSRSRKRHRTLRRSSHK